MQAPAYSKDLGLLILRVGIGVMFICHGIPKLLGGPEGWEGLAQFALPFLPGGYLAMAFGFAALAATMAVAFSTKIESVTGIGDFAKNAGWPLELLIVFVALFFIGPGRYVAGKP